MSNRILKQSSRRYASQLSDCLLSLFAAELFSPSPELYLFSAWITDLAILDNSFGQFRALLPEDTGLELTLSRLLNLLSERGTKIYVAVRKDEQNQAFLERLRQSSSIEYREVPKLHEKFLVSQHFFIRGSMNFTFSGLRENIEHTELSTEPQIVHKALLKAQEEWGRF
jgi:hypothetical protein